MCSSPSCSTPERTAPWPEGGEAGGEAADRLRVEEADHGVDLGLRADQGLMADLGLMADRGLMADLGLVDTRTPGVQGGPSSRRSRTSGMYCIKRHCIPKGLSIVTIRE